MWRLLRDLEALRVASVEITVTVEITVRLEVLTMVTMKARLQGYDVF